MVIAIIAVHTKFTIKTLTNNTVSHIMIQCYLLLLGHRTWGRR